MNLDDLEFFKKIDTQDMHGQISELPDQLQRAWEKGWAQPLPDFKDIQNIVLAGVGDSAVPADLAAASVSSSIHIPLAVHRNYGLPASASNKQTLVICISHSGDDEEMLDVFDEAIKRDCSVLVISTGGELTKHASEKKIPVWKYEHKGKSNSGIALPFGFVIALFARLNLIPDPAEDVAEAVAMMKRSQEHFVADMIAAKNPAKRYAGQLVGRWVSFVGTENLAPVAHRWKNQINQLAKAGASFEVIPDATHNTLNATLNPNQTLNAHTISLFMRAPSDHPRNTMRSDMMRQAFMLEGMNTDVVDGRGKSVISHLWTLVIFGDYMAYYLAMAYGVDPSEEDAVKNFHQTLAK